MMNPPDPNARSAKLRCFNAARVSGPSADTDIAAAFATVPRDP
ncbi:hypothetical protein [Methylobacterium sp. J-026]|nr:hypothetical protein [Methylobacterium sp. J-026]